MTELLSPQNRLFELARSGRRLPHLALAVVLTFVIIFAAALIGGAVAVAINTALALMTGQLESNDLTLADPAAVEALILPDTALEQVIFLLLSFGPIFLLLWAWLALYEKRSFSSLGLSRSRAFFFYVRGLGVGFVMFAASVGLAAALGYITFEQGNPQQQGLAALGGVLLVFLGWTVQGPAEEVITRGWLMPVIGARYSPILGVLVSSVIFAILHSLNPNLSPIAVLNLFLFGLFAALYALYEGGLWGVFSIHAVWNWAQGNLFGFEVSGQATPGGTLFNLQEAGPDAITGGPFGPEGGLAVTIVLLISCGLVWWLAQTALRPTAQAESAGK